MSNDVKRGLEIFNGNGAKITLIYDGYATDIDLANAVKSVSELSKDNYIVFLTDKQGIRIFNYLQFAQWKSKNKE